MSNSVQERQSSRVLERPWSDVGIVPPHLQKQQPHVARSVHIAIPRRTAISVSAPILSIAALSTIGIAHADELNADNISNTILIILIM